MNMNQKKIVSDGKTVNYERFKDDHVEQLKKMKIRWQNYDVECMLVLWIFQDFFFMASLLNVWVRWQKNIYNIFKAS